MPVDILAVCVDFEYSTGAGFACVSAISTERQEGCETYLCRQFVQLSRMIHIVHSR